MGTAEFWQLLLHLPKESNWHLFVVSQKYTSTETETTGSNGGIKTYDDVTAIEDPEAADRALFAAFMS